MATRMVGRFLLLVVMAATPAQEGAGWRDAAGRPLPFRTAAEVTEFLRTAAVIESTPLPTGFTRPRKLLLEKGDVRAHAVFRSYERRQERAVDPITGRPVYDDFTDSALSEFAAWELAQMLELPFVPPTAVRVIDNREGTVQLWIEHADTAGDMHERGEQPPNADWWRGIIQTLAIFDNLTFNTDRHGDNLLIDQDWRVWFIDHTRAFQSRRTLRNPESIAFAERHLWQRLQTLSDDEIRSRLGPYLGPEEMMALLARRERLVRYIEELIDERGERAVLFDYSYDLSSWRRR